MSTHRRLCVWVDCDGPHCDQDKGWPEDGPYHFDTEQAALDYLLGDDGCGWTRLPDGRLLCSSCCEKADCEVTGHQMSRWRQHANDPGIEFRSCSHCGHGFEERLTALGDPP